VVRDTHVEPIRVLVADDDPRVRQARRAFLSATPSFDVVAIADTAPTALQMARDHTPNVALLDMLLPDLHDGLRLLRTITGDLHIPAIAISIDSGLHNSALAAGALRFLDKGSTPELLTTALREAASPQQQPHRPHQPVGRQGAGSNGGDGNDSGERQ
jgi:DNA-binding NarL/FixJ family response regulator